MLLTALIHVAGTPCVSPEFQAEALRVVSSSTVSRSRGPYSVCGVLQLLCMDILCASKCACRTRWNQLVDTLN